MDGYVIMATVGEYSDRSETPIRFVVTEEEAKALVLKATEETQSGFVLPEAPPLGECPFSHWRDATPEQRALWNQMLTEHSALRDAQLRALGFVDPDGPNSEATYYYSRVYPLDTTPPTR